MKLFGLEIKRAAKKEHTKRQRAFAGIKGGNLFSSWITNQTSADVDIRRSLKKLRDRSRDLMQSDDYAKRFKKLVVTNVIGNQGIKLQNRAKDTNGNLDKQANDKIEKAFKRWSKKGNCDVTGKYSFTDIQKMVIGAMAEDGEVLIRKVKGYDNEFGFALQLIEADHLDDNYNDPEKNIVMGIEFDKWGKPIAYHLFKKHPGSMELAKFDMQRVRVPANEIIHLFLPIRISASRGVPWMYTAITRLKMTNGYEEAELVASRIAAAKGGFYKIEGDGEDVPADTTDLENRLVNELEPGQIEILPQYVDFKAYDPQHPTTAFKDFMKSILRGIASGLDVSYNSLANDLEGVSYSSLRSGVLQERDIWKDLQNWLSEHLLDDLFASWLDMALLSGAVNLPYQKYDKFNAPSWQPRSFPWVDPLKDMQANILAVKEGLKTHAQIASEMGMDIEDIYQQLSKEKELRSKYGITTLSEAEVLKVLESTTKKDEDEAKTTI